MKITVTAIKPPRGTLDKAAYRAALAAGFKQATAEAKEMMVAPVKAWKKKNQPSPVTSSNHLEGNVTIRAAIYVYQDFGTQPYTIVPKSAKVLRFRPKGAARKGKGSRSNYVYAKRVNHPGNPAQGFSEKTATAMAPRLSAILNDELAKAAT